MPEITVGLKPGEHRRYWFVEVCSDTSNDVASLPPSNDWHAVVRLFNELATVYGADYVYLYQWDVTCIDSSVTPLEAS